MTPEDGPDPRLITTPDNPGLYIYAPVQFDLGRGADDRWLHFFGPLIAQPCISYACRCGFVRRGVGDQAVRDVLANYPDHAAACPQAPPLPVPAPADTDQPENSPATGLAPLTAPAFIFDPDEAIADA